jgi:predicted MFS family arabinose efflux permease
LGDQALYALLPLYFEDIGLLPIQVGILLSANRWIRLFTNHLAERLSKQYPVHLMFASSLALGAGLTALYAFSTSFVVLLIARCLWGLCWSFIRHISVMGVVSGSERQNLGQMMGYYNGISRLGSVVGIVLGGILFDLIGFKYTLAAFCIISLMAIPFALSSGVHLSAVGYSKWANADWGSPSPALYFCGFCIGSVGPGLIMSTLGFILLSRYGQQVEVFGLILGIATLNGLLLGCRWILDSLGAPIYGALIDYFGVHIGAPLCFAIGAFVMYLLTMGDSLASLSAGIVVFFVCGTALATAVSAEASKQGSKVYARYATSGDFGAAVGPLVGWTVFELFEKPDLAFVLGAIIYTIGLLAALVAFQRPGITA